MKLTEKQLRRIIKEEKELVNEQAKFESMLLNEEGGGDMLKLAFASLKSQGPKVAEYVKQWMKSNPDILEKFLGEMIEDEKIKNMIMSLVPKEDKKAEDKKAAPAGEEAAVAEAVRRTIRKTLSEIDSDRLRSKHSKLVTRDMQDKWSSGEESWSEEHGSPEEELEEFRDYILDPHRDTDHLVFVHYRDMFDRIKHLMDKSEQTKMKRLLTRYGKKTDRYGMDMYMAWEMDRAKK